MVLAVTDEAEQSAAAAQAGPWVTEIDAVLIEAVPLMPPAEEAHLDAEDDAEEKATPAAA